MTALRTITATGGLALALAAQAGHAQSVGNSNLQTFFGQTVCGAGTATSPYLIRCQQTKDPNKPDTDNSAYADISSASESSLNPSQVLAAASNALLTAEALSRETERRLEGLRDEDDGKPGSGDGKIAGFGPWSLFATVSGEWFDQSRAAYANERAFEGDRYRGTFGADYRMGETAHLGVTVSYDEYSSTFDAEPGGRNAFGAAFTPQSTAGGRKAKTWTLTAFASAQLGDGGWIDGAVGYGWSANRFRRNATYQANLNANTVNVQASGSADGNQLFATLGLGYDGGSGATSFGPYARLRYARSKIDGYTESEATSSFLTYVVPNQKTTSLTGILGLRASQAISASWGVIVPQLRGEFEHEFEDDARTLDLRFAAQPASNASRLTITSDRPDRNHANLGASLLFVLPGGVMPFLDYEALVGYSGFTRHRVTAGLRLEF